jgi:hypothetical protein
MVWQITLIKKIEIPADADWAKHENGGRKQMQQERDLRTCCK